MKKERLEGFMKTAEIEEPYRLPEGWRWVRLGEILVDVQSGFACLKKYDTAGYPTCDQIT